MNTTHKFAVGSKLRILNADHTPFDYDDVVTVTEQITNYDFIRYAVDGDNNGTLGWDEDRFELVQPGAGGPS